MPQILSNSWCFRCFRLILCHQPELVSLVPDRTAVKEMKSNTLIFFCKVILACKIPLCFNESLPGMQWEEGLELIWPESENLWQKVHLCKIYQRSEQNWCSLHTYTSKSGPLTDYVIGNMNLITGRLEKWALAEKPSPETMTCIWKKWNLGWFQQTNTKLQFWHVNYFHFTGEAKVEHFILSRGKKKKSN